MSSKVVLIVIGIILLLLGLPTLIAGIQSKWEDRMYIKYKHKNPPANLKEVTIIVGGGTSLLGLVLLVWGLMIHQGMARPLR